MARDVRDAASDYKGETIVVRAIDGWFCPDCGEVEFAAAGEGARYSAEIRAAMDTVSAAQLAQILADPAILRAGTRTAS